MVWEIFLIDFQTTGRGWCFGLLLLAALVSGCAARAPLPVSLLPLQTDASGSGEPRLVIGDSIQVNYFLGADTDRSRYRIVAGDILRIDVLEHPQLARERVLVLPDGYISVPLADHMMAAGKEITTLVKDLAAAYWKHDIRNPQVTVSVELPNDPLVTLLQAVNTDGRRNPLVAMVDQSGLIDLPFIPPPSSRQTFSELRREIKEAYAAKFGRRLEVVVTLQQSQPPVVYVMGEVVEPGGVAYSRPLNALMAVAAAGGFLDSAKSTDIRLFRFRDDGEYDQWSFSLKSRLDEGRDEGKLAHIELQPRDVIYVPKSRIAEANRAVEQYIRKMLPFDIGAGFTYRLDDNN